MVIIRPSNRLGAATGRHVESETWFTLPVVIVFVLAQRHLGAGLVSGAVK
jgi:ABC-type glycerol-3-phosphate transport system permease component